MVILRVYVYLPEGNIGHNDAGDSSDFSNSSMSRNMFWMSLG